MQDFVERTVQPDISGSARSVAPELSVGDLLRLFAIEQTDAFPVADNGRLVGIVTRADVMRASSPKQTGAAPDRNDLMGTIVDEIMSRHPPADRVRRHASLESA